MKIKTQEIYSSLLKEKEIQLFIKRIDQIDEYASGNKWFKLKYNLLCAREQEKKTILTFGGAYSNHIAATAYLAKINGFSSIGIIRGEEKSNLNPTLSFAINNGMKIYYISRDEYRQKDTKNFLIKLEQKFDDFYLIPEGGTNILGVKGAAEILGVKDTHDYICCPVGTGGTISGIINSSREYQKVIGFSIVNDLDFLQRNIENLTTKKKWELNCNYIYGGYAKVTHSLVKFINEFYLNHNIPLDIVYTGKMMMGIFDLIKKDYFLRGSCILAIHTGGLQGNKGMNKKFCYNLPENNKFGQC